MLSEFIVLLLKYKPTEIQQLNYPVSVAELLIISEETANSQHTRKYVTFLIPQPVAMAQG